MTFKIPIMKMEYTSEAETSWFWMTVSREEILGKPNRCETKWSEPLLILKQQMTMGKMHFQSAIKMACFPSSKRSLKCLDKAFVMDRLWTTRLSDYTKPESGFDDTKIIGIVIMYNTYTYFKNQELHANKLK
jgi:hypothetical protein